MIAAAGARELLVDVEKLATALHAVVELRCDCRCRCHQPIGWAASSRLPCRSTVDPSALDCSLGCRGEKGCELGAPDLVAVAHV